MYFEHGVVEHLAKGMAFHYQERTASTSISCLKNVSNSLQAALSETHFVREELPHILAERKRVLWLKYECFGLSHISEALAKVS